MKKIWLSFQFVLLLLVLPALADDAVKKDAALIKKMKISATAFIKTLSDDQKNEAITAFTDPVRFSWYFTPRERKGLSLKNMKPEQREAAMNMIRLIMSDEGYKKATQIIDLENVLRIIENRPPNDTYRDPENYVFLIYGNPGKDPWGWRMEGHHLSIQLTVVNDQIAFTPGFMGSNPGKVLADVPQKGKTILADEQNIAFDLLHTMSPAQLEKVLLGKTAPNEIFTSNTRKASLEKIQGLSMKEMNAEQKEIFGNLILAYLQRYHVTLRNQQLSQLAKVGMGDIHFAWMGDQTPTIGPGHGHYYRIHGPTFLIEFDNTQNGGNHIHSVVRDLTNDFGEDMLKAHYAKSHH